MDPWSVWACLQKPLLFDIRVGNLEKIQGPDSGKLDILFETPENGNLCELGIGTNDKARLQGVILEDEKVYGTVHVAFGTNTSFGGVTKAACHMDGVVRRPDLYLDEMPVILSGCFTAEVLK